MMCTDYVTISGYQNISIYYLSFIYKIHCTIIYKRYTIYYINLSFMDMNTRVIKKLTTMHRPATIKRMIRLRRGVVTLLVWSKRMKPKPPTMKRKLDAIPSMMNCPLILSCMNATYNISQHIIIYVSLRIYII